MSLLTVVQTAFGELGLSSSTGYPATVATNSDPNVLRAYALANRAGIDVRDSANAYEYWPVLRKQFLFNLAGQGMFTGTFTAGSNQITNVSQTIGGIGNLGLVQNTWQISSKYVVNDTWVTGIVGSTVTMSQNANLTTGTAVDTAVAFGQEAYPTPSDLNYFLQQTGWDRNFRWQLLGPVNAQEWQVLKSGISPVGPRLRYRLMGAGQPSSLSTSPGVNTQLFTATNGQTVFTLASTPGTIFSCSLDGSVLVAGVDFTVSGVTLTLTNGALTGQTLYVVYSITTTIAAGQVNNGPLQIFMNPIPYVITSAGNTSVQNDLIVMEYASTNWVAASGSPTVATQGTYLADTDVSVLPEDMIILSLKWRILRALGMAYAEEFDDYTDWLDRNTGRQTMPRELPLNARASGIRLLNSQNVPDTGFGS